MVAKARVEPGQEVHLGFLAGHRDLIAWTTFPQAQQEGAGSLLEQRGYGLVPTWKDGTAVDSFTCFVIISLM